MSLTVGFAHLDCTLLMAPSMIGRMAPSPTGFLHPGHASSFGLAWLGARKSGGRLVLRIEDIDNSRCKPEANKAIMDDLMWLGIDYDGEVLLQTKQYEAHLAALNWLIEKNLAYPCTCSRLDIVRAASAHQESRLRAVTDRRYPGTCAIKCPDDAAKLRKEGIAYSWRLRTPKGGWPDFVDGWHGKISGLVAEDEGDFLIWRAAKGNQASGPSYQLAVVIDDTHQGVNQVVRGEDLINSTPKQIALLKLLGHPVPEYFHVPLVVNGSGNRFAKRAGSICLADLRQQGMTASDVIGRLATIWGFQQHERPLKLQDLVAQFDWEKLHNGPWLWQ